MDFDTITSALLEGQTVQNWTAAKGAYGEPFDILDIGENHIEVKPLSANALRVHRKDFESFLPLWDGYKAGSVTRAEITQITFVSKYLISIIHWYEEQES